MASPKSKTAPEAPKTAKKGRWAGKQHPWRSFPKRKAPPQPAAPPKDDDGCGRGTLEGQLRARYPEKYKKP
jgi:hypothetical protein